MTEKTITVSEAVESALATVAQRVEHEAGCATETDFSATCTCGLRDALNTLEAALASSTGPDPENGTQLRGDVEIAVRELLEQAGLQSAPQTFWGSARKREEDAWLKGRDDTLEHVGGDLEYYVGAVFDKLAESRPDPENSSGVGESAEHVRVARNLLRQAAPAIRRERATRLDGPLMSVLDALDELEKVPPPVPQSEPVVGDWKARAEKAEADLERLELANDDAADFAAVLEEEDRRFATQPEPQQGVGAGVANRDQVYAALDEHIEKAHAEIIVDILQRRCAGLGWTPDVTATALEIVRALPATQHQEVDVEGAGPTREEFKQALEILALATFEGVPLPDDLVADEYEKHGWLATGRDITDEGFCCLTDAGRDLIGTVLAEAATPPSEQGGEVAE